MQINVICVGLLNTGQDFARDVYRVVKCLGDLIVSIKSGESLGFFILNFDVRGKSEDVLLVQIIALIPDLFKKLIFQFFLYDFQWNVEKSTFFKRSYWQKVLNNVKHSEMRKIEKCWK